MNWITRMPVRIRRWLGFGVVGVLVGAGVAVAGTMSVFRIDGYKKAA